jgi:hypothetical protein
MHWKGLKYAAWRRATREELIERERAKKLKERPDYSDSLGSYEDIAQRLEKKKIHIDQEDLHQYDNVLVAEQTDDKGEVYGSSDEDMGMVTEHFDTVASLNPYDHQGESEDQIRKVSNIDREAASQGPVFDESHKLELSEEGPQVDATKELDPLALMMEAAPPQETTPQAAPVPQAPQPVQQAPPPQNVPPAQPPQAVPQAPPPQPVQPAQPPQAVPQTQPPANIPPAPAPMPQAPAPPPALGAPPQPPQALAPARPPAQAALPSPPAEKKSEEEQGQ